MAEERVVVRFETSIGRIMTQDEVDGVHRLKDWRLNAAAKSKRVIKMLQMVLMRSLVVEETGKTESLLGEQSVAGLLTMKVTPDL